MYPVPILDTIGTGGFGSVYLARDVLIDKKVAVKVPHKQGEKVEKLLREPRLLAALNHPNIVSVITAEKINDVFYIVMEYVEGESLEQYLRREGPPEISLALDWFIKIAGALVYAHDKNVLHRDIRPANILLSNDGHIKVADLGTSRYLMEEDRFASTRIGSPPYMAPEHFQGKATLQSDIYSFGILIYECLTGKLPFYDKNPKVLAQMARGGQVRPAFELNPDINPDLNRLISRAMHPKLGTRYPTVVEVLSELKRIQLSSRIESSQELAHLVGPDRNESRVTSNRSDSRHIQLPRNLPTREISSLFCWNCSKPVQKRTRNCPHCGVSLD